MEDSKRKVVLVGDGAVGSSFAFSLLQSTQVSEMVIVDLQEEHAQGDVIDLQDTLPETTPAKFYTGTYEDASDADIVVITAGVPRKSGETRLDLVNKNAKILDSIVTPVVNSGFDGVFLISSNPVDVLTSITQRLSGFPKNRIIGTGTSLDTARLRVLLAQELGIGTKGVNATIFGEHGDSSFANFDEATVNGKPLRGLPGMTNDRLDEIEEAVKRRGGQIISKKGATFYGVAVNLVRICQAILNDSDVVLPVSAPLSGQYGLSDIYIGTPAVINANGIQKVIEYPLSEAELKKMRYSAEKLNEVLLEAN
ncbi:L-lactate dehydrogenase [Secundilactobacillus kimchicus]|uniref:L-lactate dehydrogenase n=1 Tax=Secundilactobacillus kimchicus JCM 15530 TaxID=1302272 RepID=A0A0R1HYN5_9LACO|nr:L-lactate dehydrogenase [Secundilactobacillus kimchicus]KRK48737.1 L-lactate dehydrogenase [Secundilactobacillus kimchicus JCM 15530]